MVRNFQDWTELRRTFNETLCNYWQIGTHSGETYSTGCVGTTSSTSGLWDRYVSHFSEMFDCASYSAREPVRTEDLDKDFDIEDDDAFMRLIRGEHND